MILNLRGVQKFGKILLKVLIRDTLEDCATRCIPGRSTYRPQIYSVRMEIWRHLFAYRVLP